MNSQDTVSLGSPPKGSRLGPLPPRSAASLRLQFCLQPLFLVLYFGLIAAFLLLAVIGSGGELGSPRSLFLSPRRYRLERDGEAAEWAARTRRVIVAASTSADARERRGRLKKRWTAERPEISLEARDYRGLGANGVAALASEHGWALDWKRSPRPDHALVLVRTAQQQPQESTSNASTP